MYNIPQVECINFKQWISEPEYVNFKDTMDI